VIGEWFESYEEAWSYFLARETPLEDFWSELPEPDRSILAGWLIEPPPQLKDAVVPRRQRPALPDPNRALDVHAPMEGRRNASALDWVTLLGWAACCAACP
jgi:hypothetical protein